MGNSAIIKDIKTADEARIAAVLKRDRDALTRILSDDLIYVHSSGIEETKSIYINRVVSGHYDYRSFVINRRNFRFVNELVFVNGDNTVDIVVGGALRKLAALYLMVWRREETVWRLVTFHAAPIPRVD